MADRLTGTKAGLVQAALETLRTRGYAGASARQIASAGGFNQALVFYHFGSVDRLLLAALEEVSDRRMAAYASALEQADSTVELAALAKRIQAEDVENGYVTVLGEMVAAGAANPELGREVAAQLKPWIDLVARKLRSLAGMFPLARLVDPEDAAFAIVALYLGIDMLGHLEGSHARADALLDLGTRLAAIADVMRPPRSSERP